MIVYRIAKTRYVRDLSGVGARIYGGRWNGKGTDVIYTSESRSLATVEYLIHMPLSLVPEDLSIALIKISGKIASKNIQKSELPANWRDSPPPLRLAEIGNAWLLKGSSLLLRVPSAVVEHEYNILIDPGHPDMKSVSIQSVEPYHFDVRLFKGI
ncbi:MAG: RES superfamily protein [Nitrospirae bacterium CG_4_10_14_3_um_filter_53_41]|nr:MAG: RES superfamily protein [Nitrospirae bacterium CG17_big_fil_post_rev_8_21_14_2_50_50_9]PIX84610.1 MAG: RES superfamily protein [Nitrospirae bacterium CG_4_10_14_3_um_filter_53_41]